jgi:hypothetical protein
MSNFKEILDSLDRIEAICAAVEFDQLRALVVTSIDGASESPRSAIARRQMLILLRDKLMRLLEELSMAGTFLQIRRLQLTPCGTKRFPSADGR